MNISLFLLLGAILCTNAFQIESVTPERYHPTSFASLQGFPHYVGDSFGEDKAATFLNLINTAATLYRDDMEKNLRYIQTNMQASFGVGNITYNVIIQANSTSSITGRFIYNEWGDSYASFPTGTSLINPTWSYFCYILARYDNWIIQYVPQIGQGIGINIATVNEIKNIISRNDGTRKCTCQKTVNI